jgi:hypothetical protein
MVAAVVVLVQLEMPLCQETMAALVALAQTLIPLGQQQQVLVLLVITAAVVAVVLKALAL